MNTVATGRFEFHPTPLDGLWRVTRKPIRDARGFFSRFYCAAEFKAIGIDSPIAQINHSFSARCGTVRGMHFQHEPHTETKIVTCTTGRIFDVAVDLRRDSPTFMQWFGTELSAANQESLVIPRGFAHGFQALEDNAEVIYLVTSAYSAGAEDGLNPFDPEIGIAWPLPATEISERDADRAFLDRRTYRGLVL